MMLVPVDNDCYTYDGSHCSLYYVCFSVGGYVDLLILNTVTFTDECTVMVSEMVFVIIITMIQ